MSQIALPFDWPPDPRDDEFLVSESNARAVQQLERWSTWPVMAVVQACQEELAKDLSDLKYGKDIEVIE